MKTIMPQRPDWRHERLVRLQAAKDPRVGVEPLETWLTQDWLTEQFNAGLSPKVRRPFKATKASLERIRKYVKTKIKKPRC